MTVFVDDMRRLARVGTLEARWSHLMSDSPVGDSTELLAFAARLGMRSEWLQYPGRATEHFDLTDTKRDAALRLGARSIRYGHEGAALVEAKRTGRDFDLDTYRTLHGDPVALPAGQLDLF